MCLLVGDGFGQRRNENALPSSFIRGRTFVLAEGGLSGLVWRWCEGPEAAVA